MKYIISLGKDHWHLGNIRSNEDEIVILDSSCLSQMPGGSSPFNRREMIENFKERVLQHSTPWITPGYREWIFDLTRLKKEFAELASVDWLRGKIAVEPEFETTNDDAEHSALLMSEGVRPCDISEEWIGKLFFTIVPELVDKSMVSAEAPVEIQNSLQRFQMDFPKPAKAAFLIMRFRETRAHMDIYEAIGESLSTYGVTALRADEKYYHDDLYHNILTYMHGCGFGVAVFERIEEEVFNPNISLEVGYMLALQKPICILKDRTLKTLHADLIGRLYKEFDPLDARTTIHEQLSDWLRDKELI